jgi:hypothetical protein
VKWLFFSLVLANVALYLWATGHPDNAPEVAQASQGQVNSRSMMLLEERAGGATPGEVCMRIGPFLTQSTLSDASRMLAEMGLAYNQTAVSARKLNTWRVYLAAPEERSSFDELRQTLNTLEIDNYQFEDNGISYLSVGLFSQAADARNFVARLKEKGVEASYRPELRTLGPLRWIEVETLPDRHARDQLQAANWGDAMASVTSFPCAG